MSKPILICFCCNDHRNGIATGYCDQAHIDWPGGNDVEIEFGRMVFRDAGHNNIKLGRRLFPYIRYTEWVGNFCWDGVAVHPKTARDIMEYLRRRGARCLAAPTEIFEAWNAEDPLPNLEE